jgi:hypothetical protein
VKPALAPSGGRQAVEGERHVGAHRLAVALFVWTDPGLTGRYSCHDETD